MKRKHMIDCASKAATQNKHESKKSEKKKKKRRNIEKSLGKLFTIICNIQHNWLIFVMFFAIQNPTYNESKSQDEISSFKNTSFFSC